VRPTLLAHDQYVRRSQQRAADSKTCQIGKTPRGDEVRLPRELLIVLVDMGAGGRADSASIDQAPLRRQLLLVSIIARLSPTPSPLSPPHPSAKKASTPPGGYHSPVLGAISLGEHCGDLDDWHDGRLYGALK
jgi:hypothetical protein